jgi:hypothetical protein
MMCLIQRMDGWLRVSCTSERRPYAIMKRKMIDELTAWTIRSQSSTAQLPTLRDTTTAMKGEQL